VGRIFFFLVILHANRTVRVAFIVIPALDASLTLILRFYFRHATRRAFGSAAGAPLRFEMFPYHLLVLDLVVPA
jgi:hypothetical protein